MDCAVAVCHRVVLPLLRRQNFLLSSRPTAHLDRPTTKPKRLEDLARQDQATQLNKMQLDNPERLGCETDWAMY